MALKTLARKGPGGRSVLTLNKAEQPPVRNALVGPQKHFNNNPEGVELQRWTAALFSARNAWSIRQHRLGLVHDKRLSRADADRALAMALSELAGSTDSLAKVRRGGGE